MALEQVFQCGGPWSADVRQRIHSSDLGNAPGTRVDQTACRASQAACLYRLRTADRTVRLHGDR